jgi:hypothetical protein
MFARFGDCAEASILRFGDRLLVVVAFVDRGPTSHKSTEQ